MKDYTIHVNNKNKTKITFEYDHGLPYKDRVRPNMKYGLWEEDTKKMLIKVYFDDDDMKLFENKEEIIGFKNHELNDEYWIDLNDVYLIIHKNNILEKKFNENNVIIAFFFNNKFLNALEF